MAVSSSKPKFLSVLRRVEFSLNNGNFPSLNLKPLQMKCFEYMLEGQDVIGVLPTGWLIWQVHALSHFRKDFKDLSVLKAFFPSVPTMALTATAPPHLLRDLKQSLRLKNDCKIVARNPNRVNIYLDKKVRLSNLHGNESYDNP